MLIALEGADEAGIAEAVTRLTEDRDAMLESVAEDYERELAEWRASQPRPPAPLAPAMLTKRRAR
jgi:hypothetical protein